MPGAARPPGVARDGRGGAPSPRSWTTCDARLGAAEAKVGHLEVALGTNRRIGIAVGILMCRLQITEDQALAVLRKHSQDHNVKLRDLAEQVIYTGTL